MLGYSWNWVPAETTSWTREEEAEIEGRFISFKGFS